MILNCSIEENPCKIDETWTPEHSGGMHINSINPKRLIPDNVIHFFIFYFYFC